MVTVEVHHPEDLTLELDGEPILCNMSHHLPDLSTLSFDVVGVDLDHHVADEDGPAIFHGVVDGEAGVVALKLIGVGLPLVADEDGSRQDVCLDERDQNIGIAPDSQHESRQSLPIISPFDETHGPDRFGCEDISAVILQLMEMALVNLHNRPWPAKHQIAVLPCSTESLRDNAVEDITVFEPCSLRDSGRCKD